MIINPQHQKIADYVRTYMLRNAQMGDPTNGTRRATARYWHSLNVYNNINQILDGEQAIDEEREICQIGALFHDVDSYTVEHSYHATRGAETAAIFLKKEGYPADLTVQVAQAIRQHDHDFDDEQPATEQIAEMRATLPRVSLMLLDADLLDKIGVSNIMAAALPMGRTDKQAYEAARELTSGWPLERARFWRDLLTTTTGRTMGEQRFDFYCQFLEQLKTEIVMSDPFAQVAEAASV